MGGHWETSDIEKAFSAREEEKRNRTKQGAGDGRFHLEPDRVFVTWSWWC